MKTALITAALILFLAIPVFAGEYFISNSDGVLYVSDVDDMGLIMDLDASGRIKAFFTHNGDVTNVAGYWFFTGLATGKGLDIWASRDGVKWDYLGRF